ncbi:hypothetical protein NFI96_018016, partial [Prochilodus magdalenae]
PSLHVQKAWMTAEVYAQLKARDSAFKAGDKAARKTTPPSDYQVLCLTAFATIPTCLRATTIIPMPKKSSGSCLNDYRPVSLTPIIMKCFERLVMRHIKTLLPPSLDPLQFA